MNATATLAQTIAQHYDTASLAVDSYGDQHDLHDAANYSFDLTQVFLANLQVALASNAILSKDQADYVTDALDYAYSTHSHADDFYGRSFDDVTAANAYFHSFL